VVHLGSQALTEKMGADYEQLLMAVFHVFRGKKKWGFLAL
jgi:hypothetical protein